MEMYKEKLVVAIKYNGKILRENKDMVMIPFGSEFSVLVKNLNNRRVKFTLEIDGADALDGTSLIVNANSEIEVKRFIRNGNMNEGNAFKFIERTKAIEDGPRGIKIDDGTIRLEFWYEREQPVVTYTKSVLRSEMIGQPYRSFASTAQDVLLNATTAVAQNAVGITVPGSKVEQKFTSVYGFNAESTSHVIIMRLVGQVGEKEVIAPVTVDYKPQCITCGRMNKATNKFCSECGTSLILV